MHARAMVVVGLGLGLGLGLAAAPARVVAQPATVQAQSLFDEGRTLMKAGKIAQACAAFEASEKLDPVVTTQLNLADCREQNHQLASAWGAFVEAQRMARAAGNDKLLKVATSHARKLEPRLSRLTIAVPADHQVAGLTVLRGDEPIDPAGWNHALPIDGGSYAFTARAPGREPWTTSRTIKAEGEKVSIEIPRLLDAAATTPPVGAAPPAPKPSAPKPPAVTASSSTSAAAAPKPAAPDRRARAPEPSDQPQGRSRVLPLALGGGALVLGGAALGFHLWGDRTYDRARAAMTQRDQDALYHAANTRRYAAQGFAVAAIGCAGAAAYFYFRGGESRPTTAIAPLVAPEGAGLAVLGRW
jgi:hypothetical protein